MGFRQSLEGDAVLSERPAWRQPSSECKRKRQTSAALNALRASATERTPIRHHRDRVHKPFKCLDAQYRRELVRVYLTNVEGIARRFVDEKRDYLSQLTDTSRGFADFWEDLDVRARRDLGREKADVILKVRV